MAQRQDRQAVRIDTDAQRLIRLKKGVMTTARLVNDRLKSEKIRWRPVMVTLTYRDVDAWRPDHISAFINRVQMFARRRGYKLPYVWVMELQKRGAPHYHVLFWIPARLYFPKADRQGWWSYGSTRIDRVKNAVGYVAKYASKLQSKEGGKMPRGARIHGVGGITQWEKRVVAWWKLPKDFREGEEGSVVWRRQAGGGWINPETGESRQSTWGLSACAPGHVLLVEKTPGATPGAVDWSRIVEVKRELDFWQGQAERMQRVRLLEQDRVAWITSAVHQGWADLEEINPFAGWSREVRAGSVVPAV